MLYASKNLDGRLEVFVRGTDQALWHRWQVAPNNGWNGGWVSRGLPTWTVSNDSRGRVTVYDVSRLLQLLALRCPETPSAVPRCSCRWRRSPAWMSSVP